MKVLKYVMTSTFEGNTLENYSYEGKTAMTTYYENMNTYKSYRCIILENRKRVVKDNRTMNWIERKTKSLL